MPKSSVRFALSLFLVTMLVGTSGSSAQAANKFLQQGIDAFNHGQYNDAIGLLGAAKQTESDNPTLHYYLASALVKLKQNTDAIREYKIAMALQPDGQLAQYCQAALQALGAAAPAALSSDKQASTIGKSPASSHSTSKEDIPNTQEPQVVSIVNESADSHRVDMIVTNLQSLYGDIIMFRRSSESNPDAKTKELLGRYNVSRVPAIILVNDQGQAYQQFFGNIVEENVRSKVEELARMSRWKEPGVSQDPHLVEFRHEVLTELEARIASDQVRVDREIETIKASASQQMADMRSARMGGFSYGDEYNRIQTEENNKIQALRADFERRKTEWRAAAQAKIDARNH
jgi:thioredoxin-like negative regulator of GroEL